MEAEEIRNYCLNKKGVTEGFPFDETTLVFKVGGKMFLLMALEKQPLVFSAKNTADYNEELREQYYQISGAYHMNKTHWNSVICEGLKPEFIKKLIDDSYQLVYESLTKKIKLEILIHKKSIQNFLNAFCFIKHLYQDAVLLLCNVREDVQVQIFWSFSFE